MVADGLLKELIRVLSDFDRDSENVATAINNVLVCGSENLPEDGKNIFADEFEKLNLKQTLEEVLSSEESSPYLKFQAKALQ